MVNPVVAGKTMIGIAIVGLLASVLGAVLGHGLVTDFDRGVDQSLVLSAEVLETVDESFEVAGESLAIITEGVSEAEGAVGALGGSMAEGEVALEALTALTGEEIADALDALEDTLPAVEQAAASIDQTLSALSSLPLGLAYSPDQPLGESIGELRESIAGLPEDLRDQAQQAERTREELGEATERTLATADALGELNERLVVASELVEQYEQRTADATLIIEEQRETLSSSASQARLLIVGLSLVFGLGQLVPLYLGVALSRGMIPVQVEAKAAGSGLR